MLGGGGGVKAKTFSLYGKEERQIILVRRTWNSLIDMKFINSYNIGDGREG